MKKTVVGIGEVLWDILPEGKQPGGAPGNFAYHVMQLGFDGYAVSAIGKDALGDEILSFFKSKKMKVLLEPVDFPTGTVEVRLDSKGIPVYNICEDVAWDNIQLTEQMKDLAKETDAVCFGTLAMRNQVSRSSIEAFIDLVSDSSYKIFDINLRQQYYTKELIECSLQRCNILKINDEEVRIVIPMLEMGDINEDEFCKRLLGKYNLKLLILTRGTNGSAIYTQEGKVSDKPTPVVEVIDTVGAGDAFTAAFIVGIMKGNTISQAHNSAIQISAFVCSNKGAMPEYN